MLPPTTKTCTSEVLGRFRCLSPPFLLQKKTTDVCGISKMLLFLMFGHESWTLPSPKILRWRPGCHGFSELLGRWGEVLQVLPALKPHAFFSIIFPYFFPPTAEQFSGNSWVEISLQAFGRWHILPIQMLPSIYSSTLKRVAQVQIAKLSSAGITISLKLNAYSTLFIWCIKSCQGP